MKRFYQSRIVWANLLVVLLIVLSPELDQLTQTISSAVIALICIANAIARVYVRAIIEASDRREINL